MKKMFSNCESINELNLSNFDIHNVDNMTYMFEGCNSLCKLNISNFNIKKGALIKGMFDNCPHLKKNSKIKKLSGEKNCLII